MHGNGISPAPQNSRLALVGIDLARLAETGGENHVSDSNYAKGRRSNPHLVWGTVPFSSVCGDRAVRESGPEFA
jgi:hypothetical protein